MKKAIALLSLGIAISVAAAPPAQAIVGIATVNPAATIAGGVLIGAAAIGPVLAGGLTCLATAIQSGMCEELFSFLIGYAGYIYAAPVVAAIGIVLLPDVESGGTLRLEPLSASDHAFLLARTALTQAHLDAYENERAELQSLTQEVARELRDEFHTRNSNHSTDLKPLIRRSAEKWNLRKQSVSPEAFAVFSSLLTLSAHK